MKKILLTLFVMSFCLMSCTDKKAEQEKKEAAELNQQIETVKEEAEETTQELESLEKEAKEIDNALNELDNL
ncbi:hypothetical protein [Aquimarina aquimarini]|uniref:hypothetical protein n=1 Tax=Aquimarina aquimarini TaxID=1191734 RepID=UPI00131F2FFA|nr:hypothetical protein [Aquimarina aquimarini]